jgi:hypothetical protein
MTLSIMALSIMTLNVMALSITTLSIMTLSTTTHLWRLLLILFTKVEKSRDKRSSLFRRSVIYDGKCFFYIDARGFQALHSRVSSTQG